MLRSSAFPLLLATACSSSNATVARSTPGEAERVLTDHGPILGRTRDGVREFLGIPYAAAPVGALRFKPPVETAPWTTPRDALARGPACTQPTVGGYVRESAEDCLNLNVWVPTATTPGLPVMVWIHGGAFFQGSGGDPMYDGAKLAARTRAVVVTFNYRLGPLGWMSHREIAREMGRAVSPSFGILDQRAALEWVRKNIASFGGDPKKVTIFGSSAGGWSVCVHLASPGSRDLFSRATIQSGACSDALYFDRAAAEAQADALAAAVGCNGAGTLECLRHKSDRELAAALPMKKGLLLKPGIWWGPVIDGVELPRAPLELIQSGESAPVPLIIGWNKDEGTLYSLDQVTPKDVEQFVTEVFGPKAIGAAGHYAARGSERGLRDIVTDGIFACNTRRVARALASRGVPVYLYRLTRALDDPRAHDLGATHSVELFFLWANRDNDFGISEREQHISRIFMDAWGRFAHTGDPNGEGLSWPRYSREADRHLDFDDAPTAAERLKAEECEYWDAVPRGSG